MHTAISSTWLQPGVNLCHITHWQPPAALWIPATQQVQVPENSQYSTTKATSNCWIDVTLLLYGVMII